MSCPSCDDPEAPCPLHPIRRDLGSGITALLHANGSIGIQHRCVRTRPPVGLELTRAPLLQLDGGHEVLQRDPLTVRPSVACGDCGLHGWITDDVWRSA